MKRRNYRILFYVLLGLIPLIMLLAWNLSISQTFQVFKEVHQYEESLQSYPEPDKDLALLQERLRYLDPEKLGDPQFADNQLMDMISHGTEKYALQLEAFPESHRYEGKNFMVQTFKVRLSGKFSSLLKFINDAEYQHGNSRLVSVDFLREYQRKRGERLYVDLYFQSVSKSNF